MDDGEARETYRALGDFSQCSRKETAYLVKYYVQNKSKNNEETIITTPMKNIL